MLPPRILQSVVTTPVKCLLKKSNVKKSFSYPPFKKFFFVRTIYGSVCPSVKASEASNILLKSHFADMMISNSGKM